MKKSSNYIKLEFLSRSTNEGFARSAVAAFASQLDPTLDELGDIKTAVSEAVTNAIVHAYPDTLGKIVVRVRLLDAPPQFTPPQGAQMRDTVASLRLDCVLAAGMSVSRARAAEIIRQGLVQRNHTPEERVDTLLEAGDLLSIRGFGRIRLTEIGGRTRKDRISIQLEVFKRERSS